MSSLTASIRRTSEVLKRGAASQVIDYEKRFSVLKNLYDTFLSGFILTEFNPQWARKTAIEFFGTDCVRFAGVDGTMYSRPLFDMIIFFGGAYASTGTVTFAEEKPKVSYDEKLLDQNAGISSVVPIYVNDVPDVDQAFFEDEKNQQRDDAIINNATIANWIMTFAEYYLAYKLAADPKQQYRIILLDRSLSIERASLIYDTAKNELWERSALIGYKVEGEPIDANEISIARQNVINKNLRLPPPRGDYLRHAVTEAAHDFDRFTEKQLCDRLEITDEKRTKRVHRYVTRLVNENVLTEADGSYSLNPKYVRTKERIERLVTALGDQFFFAKAPHGSSIAMKIVKDGMDQWLTTVDISFLTLFTLQMLMNECWDRKILLIGITKDTAARDFKRQLIPILQEEKILDAHFQPDQFDQLPNTDRMILQSASILNPDRVRPPWSLIEYDSVFRTMVPDRDRGKGYVLGVKRNRMSLEKTFVKTYVQLSQAKSDPLLRSNVLLTDRLVYPEYDSRSASTVGFTNVFGGAEEPVEAILFRNKDVPNELQNLTMSLLVAMAPLSIPEAFGHNKPLFIADKVAKWNYGQFRRIVDTTAEWIVNNHKLRRFVFYMSTFRERRATIEAARREQT